MMLACDCQGSLGIGLEVAQGTFAVVGSRQKALAARCRFQPIVRRRLLEFRKWIFRGRRNSRAPAHPAPASKSLTPLDGNRKRAGALRQQCPLWVKRRHVRRKRSCLLYPRKQTSSGVPINATCGQKALVDRCRSTDSDSENLGSNPGSPAS
jgi:hypothetical protein